MSGGTWRRWDGTEWVPKPAPYDGVLSPSQAAYVLDLSSTNKVTLAFQLVLSAPDGGVHMLMEHQTSSGGNGFFMLTESEFGTPNVLEFDTQDFPNGYGNDIATCPRPSVGDLHNVVWVLDRTKAPVHQVYIDGVKQVMTRQGGYANNHGGTNFANDSLYMLARFGGNYPANAQITQPPTVFLRALDDDEAETLSGR